MYRGVDFTLEPPSKRTLKLLYRYWRYRFSVWWRRAHWCKNCGGCVGFHSPHCPIKTGDF